MNNLQLLDAMTDLEDSYLTEAWDRIRSSAEDGRAHTAVWRRVWIAAVAALVLSSFAAAAALGADFGAFGKALVRPVSLLEMIFITGFLNGFRARTVGYLILASFGAGMRLMVSERRDFWILGLSAPAIYTLCELMIQSNQDLYFGLPYPAGVFALCFAVGYWLCTLIGLARRILRRNRPVQERKALIAVIAVLLLSSFTLAMAVNADFRETVFSVFHIGQSEQTPDESGPADEGVLDPIGGDDIADAVKTNYFRGKGVIRLDDGMIYASQYDREGGAFYDLDENGLKALDTQSADFRYSFRGTDFHISYDYAVYCGELFLRPKVDPIVDENPYRYDWNLCTPGIDGQTAWLLLPYLDQDDYSVYPLQINVQTQEITDVLAGASFEGVHPQAWWFSEDGDWAICRDSAADQQSSDWLCDLRNGTLSPLSELVGRTVVDSWFLDAGTVVCYAENGEGVDVLRYDPASGERNVVLFDVRRGGAADGKPGMREVQYYGGHGKHVLLSTPDGSVEVLDLRDGSFVPLVGYGADDIDLTLESPDGKYVLFAWKDPTAPKAKTMQQVGVLNTETGVLKLLDRENRQTREEHLTNWLANDCFTILAFDEKDTDGWYLYVYDFR